MFRLFFLVALVFFLGFSVTSQKKSANQVMIKSKPQVIIRRLFIDFELFNMSLNSGVFNVFISLKRNMALRSTTS